MAGFTTNNDIILVRNQKPGVNSIVHGPAYVLVAEATILIANEFCSLRLRYHEHRAVD
ncbi:MAG: hypothetical protein AB3N33_02225 [Puniceicoccaceae bacterium]